MIRLTAETDKLPRRFALLLRGFAYDFGRSWPVPVCPLPVGSEMR